MIKKFGMMTASFVDVLRKSHYGFWGHVQIVQDVWVIRVMSHDTHRYT